MKKKEQTDISTINDIKEKNTKSDKKSVILEVFLKIIPIGISILALILSYFSYNNAKENSYFSRVFQPLTYYYDFDVNNEQTVQFGKYVMPTIKCKINVNSGCINKIMVIATDENNIDSIYDYNSKLTDFGLINEMAVDFDLTFSSIVEFEGSVYQYIFIYVEGTNNEWNLDCLEIEYNENRSIESISALDTTDLLRKNTENDDVQNMILTDYEMVLNEIENINL